MRVAYLIFFILEFCSQHKGFFYGLGIGVDTGLAPNALWSMNRKPDFLLANFYFAFKKKPPNIYEGFLSIIF